MNDSKRVEWVDMLRGIAIISVFIGHTTSIKYGLISGGLKVLIYSFHMPLFFFLSGYVFSFREKGYKKFIIKKIKTLIIPLIFFSVAQITFNLIYYHFLLHDINYSVEKIINQFLGIFVQQRRGGIPHPYGLFLAYL